MEKNQEIINKVLGIGCWILGIGDWISLRNFRELIIWQEGMKLTQCTYKIANHLPTEEKYGLKSQICRAAVSIPSNIAEGCSRSSEKDFKRFLEIALGSSYELETQIILLFELSMITSSDYDKISKIINKEQIKINAFISKIKQRNSLKNK